MFIVGQKDFYRGALEERISQKMVWKISFFLFSSFFFHFSQFIDFFFSFSLWSKILLIGKTQSKITGLIWAITYSKCSKCHAGRWSAKILELHNSWVDPNMFWNCQKYHLPTWPWVYSWSSLIYSAFWWSKTSLTYYLWKNNMQMFFKEKVVT